MTYDSLMPNVQDSIREMVRVFKVHDLIACNKMEMGVAIAAFVDRLGQDGEEYVHYVYSTSVNDLGLKPDQHGIYLLTSFLSNLCKTVLRRHGYSQWDNDDVMELAQDIVLRVVRGELR